MGVDADRHGDGGGDAAGHFLDAPGHVAPVGVAEDDGAGASGDGRVQRAHGVIGILIIAVEKVLRVVDHFAAFAAEKRGALFDEAQVVFQVGAQHLGDVARPAFSEDGRDRGLALDQGQQVGVVLRGQRRPARAAERRDAGMPQLLAAHGPKVLDVLRVRAGPAALDQLDAELVEHVGDVQLVVHGETDALPLRSVAEGGVIELDHEAALLSGTRPVWRA